jgi:hypothetical protein
MEKYGTARQATDGSITQKRCNFRAGQLKLTLTVFNTYNFQQNCEIFCISTAVQRESIVALLWQH